MFLRVPSFAPDKNYRTRSIGHVPCVGRSQNVVGPTPLSKPDGVSSNFQEMFLRVLSFAFDKTVDRKR